MVLVVDNYDSFTWNLVQMLGDLGAELVVEAGVSVELVRRLPPATPLLGVCLGHQAIGEAFGGRTIRASRLMHGKTAPVRHTGVGIFAGLPSPLIVTRYHSLVTDPQALPPELQPVAWSDEPEEEDEIQAVRHRERPVWGVQFHPESLFSEHGSSMLGNFLRL
jgi:anthranilate synthase component 2